MEKGVWGPPYWTEGRWGESGSALREHSYMKVQGPNIFPGEQQGGLSGRLSDFDQFTVLYDQFTEHPVSGQANA